MQILSSMYMERFFYIIPGATQEFGSEKDKTKRRETAEARDKVTAIFKKKNSISSEFSSWSILSSKCSS